MKKNILQKIDNFFSNKVYIEGCFESEKYFFHNKADIIKEFKIKDTLIDKNNKYIKLLKSTNSVSVHIRRDRFVEPDFF